jgi:glycosyltransferase involved in cell wall biosynthesis
MATLKSLLYLSKGNLPSKMAHTIQVAKMAQALSQQLENFELVTGGDIGSAFKGMDAEFQNWYGLHRQFKLVRLPTHIKVNYLFPQGYQSYRYFKLAVLYACLKSPSLVYTRSLGIVELLLKIGMPTIWEKHELIADQPHIHKFFTDKNFIGFVTISHLLAEQCIKSGLAPEKVLVAHSGVDIESFLPHQTKQLARQKLSLPQDEKIILYSGHLYDYKGIPTLLKTACSMPECRFVLVGGWANDVERVKQASETLNLPNVQLVGHVPQTELSSYLYAADILVVPTSKYWHLGETTSPLKLFEYMTVKRPIVASALPTIMTVLRDRENALLAEPDEPHSFKEAIFNLLENPILANDIAECAFQEVQNFTWDKRAERILQFSVERLKELDEYKSYPRKNLIRYIKQNSLSV